MEKFIVAKNAERKRYFFSFLKNKSDHERLEAIENLRQQFIQFIYPNAKP
jgi:hypothetical protein